MIFWLWFAVFVPTLVVITNRVHKSGILYEHLGGMMDDGHQGIATLFLVVSGIILMVIAALWPLFWAIELYGKYRDSQGT